MLNWNCFHEIDIKRSWISMIFRAQLAHFHRTFSTVCHNSRNIFCVQQFIIGGGECVLRCNSLFDGYWPKRVAFNLTSAWWFKTRCATVLLLLFIFVFVFVDVVITILVHVTIIVSCHIYRQWRIASMFYRIGCDHAIIYVNKIDKLDVCMRTWCVRIGHASLVCIISQFKSIRMFFLILLHSFLFMRLSCSANLNAFVLWHRLIWYYSVVKQFLRRIQYTQMHYLIHVSIGRWRYEILKAQWKKKENKQLYVWEDIHWNCPAFRDTTTMVIAHQKRDFEKNAKRKEIHISCSTSIINFIDLYNYTTIN